MPHSFVTTLARTIQLIFSAHNFQQQLETMTFGTKLKLKNQKPWRVNVKGGEPFEVVVPEGKLLLLTKVSLLNANNIGEPVCVLIKVDGTEFALATLHSERLPQQVCRSVFDKTWTISHNWKSGSLSCLGYTSDQPALGNVGVCAEKQDAKEVKEAKNELIFKVDSGSDEGIKSAADDGAHIYMSS